LPYMLSLPYLNANTNGSGTVFREFSRTLKLVASCYIITLSLAPLNLREMQGRAKMYLRRLPENAF
jgi:hypothetical protein